MNFKEQSTEWITESAKHRYSYNFTWLGRPIIQYPQDILALQQLIWQVRPDTIIETGVALGGGLILYASLLELNALCDGPPDAQVIGVEVNLFPENRIAIRDHPLSKRIRIIEGSSVAPRVIEAVKQQATPHSEADRQAGRPCVLVCLDSSHTHAHVLAELEAYAPLVTPGSYVVVFDTVVENMPADSFPGKPWSVGNNPATAVREYLESHPEFEPDREMDERLMVSAAPGGYLRRLR
jgi:cephalosporin hydroxylase